MQNLKIDIITNSGFVNLDTEFEKLFSITKDISIATAFISRSTIGIIKQYLKSCIKDNKQLRLIVGLYGGFNSKDDLKELLKLAKKYPNNFFSHISRNSAFHWKYYSFSLNNNVTAYVGSANFTTSGLNNAGELTIQIKGKTNTREIKILKTEFVKLWETDSIDIFDFPIEKYHSNRSKLIESNGFKMDASIKRLLHSPTRRLSRKVSRKLNRKLKPDSSRCYLIRMDFEGTTETMKTIYMKKSNWEKNKYELLIADSKSEYLKWNKYNYILLFTVNRNEKTLALCEVMDSTEFKTDEGKYFLALRKVKGTGIKRLTAIRTKQKLRRIGLNSTSWQNDRVLTSFQEKEIFDLFQVK